MVEEKVDYPSLHKALQTVTDRNPEFLVPVLTAVWDLIPAEAFELIKGGDGYTKCLDDATDPLVKNMPTEAVEFLFEMNKFRQWAVARSVMNRPQFPVEAEAEKAEVTL